MYVVSMVPWNNHSGAEPVRGVEGLHLFTFLACVGGDVAEDGAGWAVDGVAA